ncbi:MAG TPA: dethiobiotin synthase [Candidatus Luteimonas excrementigallinarum]|nr:dethiobiotin synthase [Candidatus Luteimonas excrementigallinarum]
MSAARIYVTGTDTGVGKSLASAALLHALRARGQRAVGMKPVASGCERTPDGWRNEDALLLQEASDPRPAYEDVNPYALPAPTAPQLAAREAGVEVRMDPLQAACTRLSAMADTVVVEGVGGWMAPLADGLDQATLARAIGADVVLVVGLRLGCLSHARLTARAVEADGLRLAGWIGSGVDPVPHRQQEYVELLRNALPVPCLGVIPHMPEPDASLASRAINAPSL